MRRRTFTSIIRIMSLIVVLFVCIFLCFGFYSFPSTTWITRNYFNAVIAEDMSRALALTTTTDPETGHLAYCRSSTEAMAKDDIVKYGSAEVRNVAITLRGG
jgi:hypothetical protein